MASKWRIWQTLWQTATLLILALLATIPATAQHDLPDPPAKTVTMPFQSANSMLLVRVSVNGREYTMLLDTGARVTLIKDETHVQVSDAPTFNTGHGLTLDARAKNVHLVIGDFQFKDFQVLETNLKDLDARLGRKVDGILGEDVLMTFSVVTINYKTKTISMMR